MCRWFAYLSPTEECLLEDVLITPAHALAKQVHDHYLPKPISYEPDSLTTEAEIALRNRLFNVDGFGVAWYTQARTDFGNSSGKWPAVYKNSQPPTNDANFHSICRNTATTACFAHIRAATTTAVTPINNHPFLFGRHTIMHNGVITDFLDIKRDMLDEIEKNAYENIHGSTDSEHFAALYMTYLARLGHVQCKASWESCNYNCNEMREALIEAVVTVISLQQKSLGQKAQANSLNVAVTDGEKMVALRFRNQEFEQPPSLYWSTEAGVTLNRKYPDLPDGRINPVAYRDPSQHGSHVIIASEPSTYKREQWNLIPKNKSLSVDEYGVVKIMPVEISPTFMAKATTTQHA